MIYNVLVENYTDCLVPNATPEADGGEISQSDSEVEIAEVYPECRRVANTKNGGLAIVPGWQWQRADGQIGYCILPNSGGEKYYYPGLNQLERVLDSTSTISQGAPSQQLVFI